MRLEQAGDHAGSRAFFCIVKTSRRILPFLALSCLMLAASCTRGAPRSPAWYPILDTSLLEKSTNVDFIAGLKGYQQTTDYTCGPASLLSLSCYYGLPGFSPDRESEMRIAAETGARDPANLAPGERPGLAPEAALSWLRKQGFRAELSFEEQGDYSALNRLRENIRKGIPTMVCCISYGEHWVIAVGYDDRGTETMEDDVIIFADSADIGDDHKDGYSFKNADRFYWCWFDVLYYDRLKWRPMITLSYSAKSLE